ncbi:AMP-binding protein [Nesterenkonia lutea]|uniref:O-succinylbenzoic acid--CoA ligase n=1 Tax=Nesterenkonia lutea TaxID=272919 RepID=A0ABR9JAK2_9MICC|nr:AMP-binding protein [Nesterenkonia lutea]MBE1522953.1 O-succinylbenzoic acid--CoA ligase [Nesterenkonia lutea]
MSAGIPQGDSWVHAALDALHRSLDDDRSPIEFHPAAGDASPLWSIRGDVPPDQAAAIVRTSGSTGTPKQTRLSAAALESSLRATAQALGGHGQWLLTLQPSYVAGLAVLSRSLAAGSVPIPLLQDTTDPERFTEAAQRLTGQRRYVSLVPTQLQRLLDHVPEHPSLAAVLSRFDVILLGGGPGSPALLESARGQGLTVVRTYGMSETCGGCVYEGCPLPGVRLSTEGSGRVRITGPVVASGYVGDDELTAAHFSQDAETGMRSFLTDDLGEIRTDAQGQQLVISGRVDDVINTGGVKVSAARVRAALLTHPLVRDAVVGPVPDLEWGQMVGAALLLAPAGAAAGTIEQPQLERELKDLVRGALGPPAAPRRLLLLTELPLLSSGKPDRQQLLHLLAEGPGREEREDTTWQH